MAAGIERNVSLKLTQLGLDIDRTTCLDNLRRILDAARTHEFFVRIDMENSPYVDTTLDVFETVWGQGYHNAGVVLQSALTRSEADAKRVNALGARVRLVKGAYKEPAAVAYQRKADVDAAYVRIMEALLTDGTYPALATHDVRMIEATKRFAAERGLGEGRLRVPDALRHPPRPADGAHRRRLPVPRVRAVRHRVVPVLHAAAGRAPGQRRLRA